MSTPLEDWCQNWGWLVVLLEYQRPVVNLNSAPAAVEIACPFSRRKPNLELAEKRASKQVFTLMKFPLFALYPFPLLSPLLATETGEAFFGLPP
jgi:hypothetical protein